MADTGFKSAGGIVSAGSWTNFTTTQIGTSDNTRAQVLGASFLAGTVNNFSFGLSSGITINGIEVQAEFQSTNANAGELQLSLSWNNGSNYTATKLDSVSGTTDATKTYGGAADTWGRSWSYSEFADGTFVAKIEGRGSGGGGGVRLDYFAIKVYYTTAQNTAGFFLAFLGAQ